MLSAPTYSPGDVLRSHYKVKLMRRLALLIRWFASLMRWFALLMRWFALLMRWFA
ncbi:hypothetical protein LC607_34400 [Nostoc sp. CHAB 5824]|nr:hypothetical protein [Nostoc sp. CHAB 5824]